MTKIILFVLIGSLFIVSMACQSETAPNANSANTITNIDPKNMPPGLTGSPAAPSGNSTPGIPGANSVNVNASAKGTPTPGIPDPKNAGKPLPKGATPTPGIPDPETLKRQANGSLVNANASTPSRSNVNSKTGANRP